MIFFNAWRAFIAIWYPGGCVIHFLCAIFWSYTYARTCGKALNLTQ